MCRQFSCLWAIDRRRNPRRIADTESKRRFDMERAQHSHGHSRRFDAGSRGTYSFLQVKGREYKSSLPARASATFVSSRNSHSDGGTFHRTRGMNGTYGRQCVCRRGLRARCRRRRHMVAINIDYVRSYVKDPKPKCNSRNPQPMASMHNGVKATSWVYRE